MQITLYYRYFFQHFFKYNMKTRSKAKTIPRKTIDYNQSKENQPQNITKVYPKPQPKKEEWSLEKLQPSYIPDRLIGRTQQKQQIYSFIQNCIMNRINCKVLYISGVPGVGKTASTMQILRQLQEQLENQIECHYINTMTLKKPVDIYRVIYHYLSHREKKEKGYYGQEIEEILATTKINHVLVIDQIDFLMTRDQEIFYNLFEWTSQITTKLAMIVISNTIDFPELLSQKIVSRMGHHRIAFKPYSPQEIKDVIDNRLENCKYFTNDAVMYASKKLSGYSSDIRTILQILHKAVADHLQEGGKGQIGVARISKIWEERVNKRQEIDHLAPLHAKIIDFVKHQGGECLSRRLYEVLSQNGIVQIDMLILLQQLSQMGFITLKEIVKSGFRSHMIKLSSNLM